MPQPQARPKRRAWRGLIVNKGQEKPKKHEKAVEARVVWQDTALRETEAIASQKKLERGL